MLSIRIHYPLLCLQAPVSAEIDPPALPAEDLE